MDTIIRLLSSYGVYGVCIAAFFEAIIFPPPVEVILLPVMLANPEHALYYSIITVAASMAGAAVGYQIGRVAGRPLLIRFFKTKGVGEVESAYGKYGMLAVVTSAFTPIPYELYILSAGAFKMKFYKFFISAFIGRILRYIPEGAAIQYFGRSIKSGTYREISMFVTCMLILILLYILIRKRINIKK